MNNVEKNRILKLHLQEQKHGGGGASKGGTNTSSSGQYDGNGFKGDGILTNSGRQEDIGKLPDVVDITKGSEGITFDLTGDFSDKGLNGGEKILPPPQPLANQNWAGPPQPLNTGNPWTTSNGDIIDITGITNIVEVIEILQELGLYLGKIPGSWLTIEQIMGGINAGGTHSITDIKACIGAGGGNSCLPMIFNSFPPNGGDVNMLTPTSSDEDEDVIDKPLSLSCCKKCNNGMYSNKCSPFNSDEDEDCIFPTLEVCEDESEPRLPSMLDIFS